MENIVINNIIDQYDAFLIDLWGVVHDGVTPFPGVVDCLNKLISINKKILFLSNAPRPGSILVKKLQTFGVNTSPSMILSSGDVVRYQLTHFEDPFFNQFGRRFYHLGSNRNQDILAGLAITVFDTLEETDIILVTAYMDEEENLNQYDEFLKKARQLNLPLICANPDKIIHEGKQLRYCAGVIAEKYEKLGGITHYYGKPYPEIYHFALESLKGQGIVDKKKILAIGDTFETDILGAKGVGLDSALVLTGNMERRMKEKMILELKNETKNKSAYCTELCNEYKINPTIILDHLACLS